MKKVDSLINELNQSTKWQKWVARGTIALAGATFLLVLITFFK
jgi:hypothetical protein